MAVFVDALLNTKEHEFMVQPKYWSCGQLMPGVFASSLTAGNYVTLGRLHTGCSYADSCLSEQEELWKYVRDM